MGVLALSGNTSFVGFARLCRLIAADHYLPHAFAIVGRPLVYAVRLPVLLTLFKLVKRHYLRTARQFQTHAPLELDLPGPPVVVVSTRRLEQADGEIARPRRATLARHQYGAERLDAAKPARIRLAGER